MALAAVVAPSATTSVPLAAVCVIALYSYPYAFAFVSSALELVPSEMERSAELLGANWLRTTWRITLPLVRPAIIAGALMSFLEAIAEFGTPAFLLIPRSLSKPLSRYLPPRPCPDAGSSRSTPGSW